MKKLKDDVKKLEKKLNRIKDTIELATTSDTQIINDLFIINGILPLDEIIDRYINYALDKCDGNQTVCAELLGRSRATLWRMLNNKEDVK